MDVAQEKHQSHKDRDQIDVLHDLFPVHLALSLHQGLSVRPHDDRLYTQKAAGIDHPFFSQDRRHQWQDQIARI